MARYTNIRKADSLKIALTNLQAYEGLSETAKKTAYEAAAKVGDAKRVNRSSRLVYIQPFGASFSNLWYITKALAPSTDNPTPDAKEENDTTLQGIVVSSCAPYIALAYPTKANASVSPALKLKFAKVRVTDKAAAGTPTSSRITKRPYNKINSNTLSSPFGNHQTTSGEEAGAVASIRALVIATNVPRRTISFSPQAIKV